MAFFQFIKLDRRGANNPHSVIVHFRHVCDQYKDEPHTCQYGLLTLNNYGTTYTCGCQERVPLGTWTRWYQRHQLAQRLEGEL